MPSPSERIEHIVVLMMENRSFDHMLGFLPREGHLRDVEGLAGKEYNLADPTDPNSQKFFVSIYHNLADAGYTWSVYHQNFDIVMNFTELHYGDAKNPNALNFRDYALFKQDIATGRLARYSFINPRFISHWNDLTQDVELVNSQATMVSAISANSPSAMDQ